ncbi:VOC family protein [Streptomyces sp. NPDC050560]|uniref:VOC family protein n=1 Tax=Streptomyces sp. NPDC050560 TaxID=3365630 RepID=UPI00379236DC
MNNPDLSPTPRLGQIGVVVTDMAAALAFYRLLGLAFPPGSEQLPHAEAPLPGGLRFALDTEVTVRSFHSGWQPPAGSSRVSAAFLCGTPADVDRVYGELTAAGHRSAHEPWDAVWGQRYAIVLDPDGNGVDLYAPLPDAGV